MDDRDLHRRFDYHPPRDDDTKNTHQQIRHEMYAVAYAVNDLLPDGREKSTAISKLEEAMMWANAGIARHGSDHPLTTE